MRTVVKTALIETRAKSRARGPARGPYRGGSRSSPPPPPPPRPSGARSRGPPQLGPECFSSSVSVTGTMVLEYSHVLSAFIRVHPRPISFPPHPVPQPRDVRHMMPTVPRVQRRVLLQPDRPQLGMPEG